jgi:predicted nucleotide-binding protein
MPVQWTKDLVKTRLEEGGLQVLFEKAIDHGVQLTLVEGTIVCIYNTGKAVVQGKANDEKVVAQGLLAVPAPKNSAMKVATPIPGAATLAAEAGAPAYTGKGASEPKVFIVYGHDKESRKALELLLLRLDIKPVILSQMIPNGNTIIEALIEHSEVTCAIVLLTPDDEGHPAGAPDKKRFRARQNVVLELGMFLTKLGRNKVIILHKGEVELPSDIGGLIYIAYSKEVEEVKAKVAAALQKIGFNIDIAKLSAE